MREILQLIEEMQAHQKQASRKSRQHRRQIGTRLEQMQADIGETRAGLRMAQEGLLATREALETVAQGLSQTQAAMAGLDRSVSGLRADVDQLQAADSLKDEHLGRLARAMNAFVDGTEQRLVNVESRLERLEQRIA